MENLHQKKVIIPATEFWDEGREEFIVSDGGELVLEHSLASISKWEALTCLPFFSNKEKTREETLQYIKCMTVNDVSPDIYDSLSESVYREISDYINAKMTATWFRKDNQKGPRNSRVITSELVYFWMIANNIPLECEHWHFNRLMTLIRVCSEENKPKDKKNHFTKSDAAARRLLNQQRRSALHSKG